jgi:threonine 3-dehydrogenase
MGATETALMQALDMVRLCGTVVTISTFNNPITFNPYFKMTRREIKLQSTMGRTWETWRRMTQLIDSGKVDLKPFVTHILPMEEYQQGFEMVTRGDVMKVLLKP